VVTATRQAGLLEDRRLRGGERQWEAGTSTCLSTPLLPQRAPIFHFLGHALAGPLQLTSDREGFGRMASPCNTSPKRPREQQSPAGLNALLSILASWELPWQPLSIHSPYCVSQWPSAWDLLV